LTDRIYVWTKPEGHLCLQLVCGRKVPLHVYMWEQAGRPCLPKGWVLHHIDENPLNNALDNLWPMTRSQHLELHINNESFRGYYLHGNMAHFGKG